LGNPPFMGQAHISARLGDGYRDWIFMIHSGAGGKADLSTHFFRRADTLLGEHGTIGLIATNTIAQGDTREGGLKPLLAAGFRIYEAIRSLPWPGVAAVSVSVVNLAKGSCARTELPCRLDGKLVPVINSRLRPTP